MRVRSAKSALGWSAFVMAVLSSDPTARAQEAPPGSAPAAIERGRELFLRDWSPGDPRTHGGDGLGPVFNARSCVDCHNQGGIGGASANHRNIEIATVVRGPGSLANGGFFYSFSMSMGNGQFRYQLGGDPSAAAGAGERPLDAAALAAIHPGFREGSSVVLHRFGTDPAYRAWRQTVLGPRPAFRIEASQRSAVPLFGLGLIDAIPDRVIEAAARRRHTNWPSIRGRVSRLSDGRIGRLGWKGQTATLQDFVRAAAATELGLEVPGHRQASDPRPDAIVSPGEPGLDMIEEEVEAIVDFVRALPRPIAAEPGTASEANEIRAGRSLFRRIGCAECHVPDFGGVEGVYTDLLLHDMSPRLGDSGPYRVFLAGAREPARIDGDGDRNRELRPASPGEWRTPPLWGLKDSAPYLHDGRAGSVTEAILLHGGEAEPSARRFTQLGDRQRRQLTAFLDSLIAPQQEADRQ